MVKLPSGLKHEIREVGVVSLYFFFCFGVMLTLKKLLLADYKVEIHVLSTAAISALIVAKIVIILDKTNAGSRMEENYSVLLAALYKTLIYVMATFIVLFVEKLFHIYRSSGSFEQTVWFEWEHRDRNVMLAKILCIGLSFFIYHLYAGLDRRLGQGILLRQMTANPNRTDSDKT